MTHKRELWIDYVKVIACFFVLLGHLLQSLIKASVMPENSIYYWFNNTIYYFHVPLFFVCSGFLHQQFSDVSSVQKWLDNVRKKALILGIPFFAFSFATWLLKMVFSSSVNSESGSLLDILFVHPTSPYWYLYVLFFVFLITPTFKTQQTGLFMLLAALCAKVFCIVYPGIPIYLFLKLCEYEVWFVIGMMMTTVDIHRRKHVFVGSVLLVTFVLLSQKTYDIDSGLIAFFMGGLACIAILLLLMSSKKNAFLDVCAKYTLPVFLMHTLCAAPTRILLMKCGIIDLTIHIIVGLIASVLGPLFLLKLLRFVKMDFLVYPQKLIKKRNNYENSVC